MAWRIYTWKSCLSSSQIVIFGASRCSALDLTEWGVTKTYRRAPPSRPPAPPPRHSNARRSIGDGSVNQVLGNSKRLVLKYSTVGESELGWRWPTPVHVAFTLDPEMPVIRKALSILFHAALHCLKIG